jgi:hypothetical protein
LIQQGIVFGLILKTPIISALQYVASGIMGEAAFAGGLATALFGLVLDFIIITIMAGVFIFSVDRIPLLRRNVIVGSILYGRRFHRDELNCPASQRRACVASSTIVATHRTRPAAHSAHRAAVGNTRTAEYAVNKKITYESEATRIAQAKVSIQFESVADGTKITSQPLAMTYHSFSG